MEVIVTSYCFLIDRSEFARSTFEIYDLGRTVYRELSIDVCRGVFRIEKSEIVMSVFGIPPSHIPITVVTPLIVNELVDTDSIFAKVFVEKPGLEKDTIFPTLAIPMKFPLDVITVLIPDAEPAVILT